ncbi:unnamed protein product [Rhizoctonia solani]|uniref:Uncharacterized protein n=1 Tax=Rhizoctonia solani TaxID=456999 RepID=A0A8H3ANG9_9AGAM|nr:unnamed protein product [Rhizoctonia solani]
MDQHLADQVASLLESTAALHRTLTHVVSQLPAHHSQLPSSSDLNLTTPASAQASILAPGVPIPSRGWQKNHSPRQRVVADTKARLEKDGWPDCEDTDVHAARLSEAMLRMGMEDMDNFATEASRLNCSNMAISATLVSAIVATFMSETYSNTESMHMQVVNGLWFLSLFLSLATATLCFTSPDPHSFTYSQRMVNLVNLPRTPGSLAFIPPYSHSTQVSLDAPVHIFILRGPFGPDVEREYDGCMRGSFCGCRIIYPLLRLRDRSVPAVRPIIRHQRIRRQRLSGAEGADLDPIYAWHTPLYQLHLHLWGQPDAKPDSKVVYPKRKPPQVLGPIPQRPELLRGDVLDSEKTLTLALETATVNKGVNAGQTLSPSSIRETSQPGSSQSKQQGSSQFKQQGTSQFKQRGSSPLRDRSPLSVCSQPPPGVESPDPQATSRVGTPLSMMSAADFVDPEVEHQRKLRATRLKRLTEFDILRPVRSTSARASDV